jgi:hypothetical protein
MRIMTYVRTGLWVMAVYTGLGGYQKRLHGECVRRWKTFTIGLHNWKIATDTDAPIFLEMGFEHIATVYIGDEYLPSWCFGTMYSP